MTASDLCQKALRTINAIGQGVTLKAPDLEVAFQALNDMLDAWAAIRLTIYYTARAAYPVVANQGSPSNPYTIGPGGDFDQTRPTWISNANLNLLTTQPPLELPLNVLQQGEYALIGIKELASALASDLYYNNRFPTTGVDRGLGEIFLYPVPNGQQSLELVLYTPIPLGQFADKTATNYTFPPGYAEALRYQLAKRLCVEFSKPVTPELETMCSETFGVIQRPNGRMPTLTSQGSGLPGTQRITGLYNWRSDQGR